MMDGTSLNLEGQLLQFICPFIQTCRSLRSSHFHFLLGQAGQARKMRKAKRSKKNCSAGLTCQAWLNLQGTRVPTGKASRAIKVHKPPHHKQKKSSSRLKKDVIEMKKW